MKLSIGILSELCCQCGSSSRAAAAQSISAAEESSEIQLKAFFGEKKTEPHKTVISRSFIKG